MATSGEVVKVNPPQVHGVIRADKTFDEYHFVMPNSVKPGEDGILLSVGDRVTFEVDGKMVKHLSREGVPSITFTANPLDIIVGNSSVLTYTSEQADSITIEPEVGPMRLPSGFTSVTPVVTTEYVLTARNGKGTSTAKATVVVTDPH